MNAPGRRRLPRKQFGPKGLRFESAAFRTSLQANNSAVRVSVLQTESRGFESLFAYREPTGHLIFSSQSSVNAGFFALLKLQFGGSRNEILRIGRVNARGWQLAWKAMRRRRRAGVRVVRPPSVWIVRKVNVNGFDGLVANQWAPQGVGFESSAFRQL